MGVPFVKMNGAGNDFVVVNALEQPFRPTAEEARAICDRETGQGCDQLIAIEPSETADAFMQVWNADGGSVETCGNALRCVGWILMMSSQRQTATIDTLGGLTTARLEQDGSITVDMGPPRLDWTEVPLAEAMDTRGIELQVGPIDAPVLHTPGAVSMGNPHVVFFVDHTPDDAFVRGSGSLVEHHPLFPQGVNVGFAQVLDRDHIRLRVWERGAGLTRACGTGACAALVAAARRNLTDRSAAIDVDGGRLLVRWDEDTGHLFMTGPVEFERTGVLTLDSSGAKPRP